MMLARPRSPRSTSRRAPALVSIFVLLGILSACSHSGERHRLFGPIIVDEKGVELYATDSIRIEGTINRLMISIPANLHPDYDLFQLVDSARSITEISADVGLANGQVFTFSAHRRMPGAPGYPGRLLQIEPEPSAHLSGSVVRIRLFSTRPISIPTIEWQSFDNGM